MLKINLEMEMKENQVVVFVVPSKNYRTALEEIVGAATKIHNMICYLSLNKPYTTLTKEFKGGGIDTKKILFIDCVKGVDEKQKEGQVLFVSSPDALTELSITVTKALLMHVDCILFDSLSTLLVYGSQASAIKFTHLLVSKLRISEKGCIFICLEEDAHEDFIKNLGMFSDKIIFTGKEKGR